MRVTYQPGDPIEYRVICAEFDVRLTPLESEDGRFIAHSATRFYCPTCGRKFTSLKLSRSPVAICPKCAGAADRIPYMVDVAENAGRGKCSCEAFTCHKKDLKGPDALNPCKHLAAALLLFGHFKAADLAERQRQLKQHHSRSSHYQNIEP